MKISKLIEKLEKVKDEHGDLVVTQHQWNDPSRPNHVQGIEVAEVKPDYYRGNVPETYIFVDSLEHKGHGRDSPAAIEYQRKMELLPTVKVLHIFYDRA